MFTGVFTLAALLTRKVGYRLARGESLQEILASLDGVSEGVETALALEQLIKTRIGAGPPDAFDFRFPIIAGVVSIVKGEATPEYELKLLMSYPLRSENRASIS